MRLFSALAADGEIAYQERMKATRRLSRRSFLARVAGGGVAFGALAAVAGDAAAQETDSDSGPKADAAGHGRGRTGESDGDSQ